MLALRRAGPALVHRGRRGAGEASGTPALRGLPASGPRGLGRGAGERPLPLQRVSRRVPAGTGGHHPQGLGPVARRRLAGRDADDAGASDPLGAGRAALAAVLRAARGGPGRRLPHRGPRRLPARGRRAARRAAGRRGVLPPLRLQDGHRHRQDDRDGHARRVVDPQQGERPQRQAVLRRGACRLPQRDHPRPAGGDRPAPG